MTKYCFIFLLYLFIDELFVEKTKLPMSFIIYRVKLPIEFDDIGKATKSTSSAGLTSYLFKKYITCGLIN